ncbi:Os03g0594500 [Oryza sativa Japonica Group]|uniref:Os03g0594500 protein n=1 Tax=Oryza sativa subsp. japonica TaxID=39947 RepID=A0A0P0W039_ORYSJ|nr:hypothetical protein EE612_018726 [Oryza sativa]BAS85148.1 Os03g0594500 [Oryza sativa Japonica Group]
MEAREKGRAAAGRGGVRGCGGGEAAAETQVKGEGGGRARRLRLRRRARRSDGRPAMRRRRHGVGGRAAAPWPQLGGNRSWFKLPMLSSQQASYVSEDQQREVRRRRRRRGPHPRVAGEVHIRGAGGGERT